VFYISRFCRWKSDKILFLYFCWYKCQRTLKTDSLWKCDQFDYDGRFYAHFRCVLL